MSNWLRSEVPQRIKRVRGYMEQEGIDALLLFSGANLAYFTGLPVVRSGSRPAALVLPRRGEPALIVHEARQYEARALGLVRDVRTYTRLSYLPIDALRRAIQDLGLVRGTFGVEFGGEMVLDASFGDVLALQDALAPARLTDASQLLWQVRMIKSVGEIERVQRACDITSRAYEQTFSTVVAGMREIDVEGTMLAAMLGLGGRSPWALITSGSGNYDMVSKGATERVLETGDMVWMDCGCSVDGYWSDFSRAMVIGGPSQAQQDVQLQINTITEVGIQMLRPGTPVAEVAARCNAAVAALAVPISSSISGLAGRVGHGLGLLVTELPSVSEADQTVLAPGMIITIEPGVATDFGTFHTEQNVLVTPSEPQVLSASDWKRRSTMAGL
jgi:Xaa-Pro aminopeptidase